MNTRPKSKSIYNMFNLWNEIDIKRYKENFKQSKYQLFNALENSAARRGAVTGIQGLATVAASDHLPVALSFKGIKLCSWNLLADQHLENCFMNVTRKTHFKELFPIKTRVHWTSILNMLGQYILEHSVQVDGIYQVNLTHGLLQNFIEEQEQKNSKENVEIFREMLSVLLDPNNQNQQEFEIILKYIIEISYYLKHGDLLWEKRLNHIKHNKTLLECLITQDILCFQECTKPQDMLNLLMEQIKTSKSDKNYAMIFHKVDEKSSDHCVIIYDQNKFACQEQNNFGLQFDQTKKKYRKPAIMAKFSKNNAVTNSMFVIGSIHHPGGKDSELFEIIRQAKQLANINQKEPLDMVVLGDYNHKSEFFEAELANTEFSIIMPKRGTMAGPEYGNFNAPIDGALTNQPKHLNVNVLSNLKFSENIELPLNIEINLLQSDKRNVLK